MADHFSGEISIGGKVPLSKIPGLIEAINAQECSHGWGDKTIKMPYPKDHLMEATEKLLTLINDDGIIWVCDEQARNGELEEIEDYCEENNIGFTRISSGYCEYEPETKEFRPGMKSPIVILTNDDGNEMIPAGEVRELIEAVENLGGTAENIDREDFMSLIEKNGIVKTFLPVLPPVLEPFEIVE